MSKQEQLMELLKKEVRSQLLAAKEGLTPAQLEQEYLAMVGRPLPLRELGFCSTMELVASMPGVVQVCPNSKGGFLLKGEAFLLAGREGLLGTMRWGEAVPQSEGPVAGNPKAVYGSLLLLVFLALPFCFSCLLLFG